jgi:O6-methylguanine-DNA--protein-cysteine methyltransferase
MIERIVTTLLKLSHRTEEVFTSIAQSYPRLLDEVNKGKTISFGLGNRVYRIDDAGLKENTGAGIRMAISNMQEVTESFLERAHRIRQEEELLLGSLSGDTKRIVEMQSAINDIIDISQALQIVALNSLVFAIKTGKEGGGFSFITEEMKKNTDRIIDDAKILSDTEDRIKHVHDIFIADVKKIQELETMIFRSIDGDIRGVLNNLVAGIDSISTFLTQLFEQSEEIKPPLFAIMEHIQHQDIISQATDQVIHSLSGIGKEPGKTAEETCDELSFSLKTVEICTEILSQVDTKIKESITIFESNLTVIEKIVSDLQNQERSFFHSFEQEDGSRLAFLLQNVRNYFNDLLENIKEAVSLRYTVTEDTRKILDNVERISESIEDIAGRITRLKSVNIAARIEVVKHSVLEGMSQTVREMGEQISDIESHSDNVLKITGEVMAETLPNMKATQGISWKISSNFGEYNRTIDDNGRILVELVQDVEQSLEGFTLFSGKFFNLLKESREELDSMKELTTDISMVVDEFAKIREDAEREMKRLIENMGKTSWDLKDEKFLEIVKKFTIYSHKERAGEIAGLSIEKERSEEGEVTLF